MQGSISYETSEKRAGRAPGPDDGAVQRGLQLLRPGQRLDLPASEEQHLALAHVDTAARQHQKNPELPGKTVTE